MSLDTLKVGVFTAEAMGHLEEEFPSSDAEIVDVCLVVAVRHDAVTTVRYACTDERQYVARGLLEEAVDAARFGTIYDEG